MQIKQILHSDEELIARFNQRFVERWHRLLRVYRERRKLRPGMDALRAATVALVFFEAASSGNAEVVNDFDNILCGCGQNVMTLNEVPVRIEDDVEKLFIWDTAALMMETDESLPGRAQWAYDMVGGHVWMAYSLDSNSSLMHSACSPATASMIEVKPVNARVPAISQELRQWMMEWVERVGTEQDAMTIARLMKDNIMERYFSQDIGDINSMIVKARRKEGTKVLNEFKAGSNPTLNQQ